MTRSNATHPNMRYINPTSLDTQAVTGGPFETIEHAGRHGLLARSVHARMTFERHNLNTDHGALTLWVLPQEDLGGVAHMVHFDRHEPDYRYYGLLGDHTDLRDRGSQRFHLRYSNDWWRNLTAQFYRQTADCPGYRAIVAPDHFRFDKRQWYQIAVTWDRPGSRFRVFVNGIRVAAETPYLPMTSEPCGETLYAGNPSFGLSDLRFYDTFLEDEAAAALYAEDEYLKPVAVDTRLARQHRGHELPRFDWQADDSWQTQWDLPLTRPQDAERFVVQGQQDAHRVTPEGLRVETIRDPNHRDSLEFNQCETYLWSDRVFEGDINLEFDFQVLERNGLSLVMLHASGMQREDFMADYPLRADGSMSMVCWENVRNYHWEYYREIDNCRNDVETHLFVKNPWMHGLAYQCRPRPIKLSRWHHLQFVQEAGRLRGAIDHELIFDVQDAPDQNHGPVFDRGRIAIRAKFKTSMLFRNLIVRTRQPS